jgi:hypothetical protein
MKYEITYTIKGFLKVFVDVVEAENINEAEVALKKQATELVGNKQVSIVFVKSI